ncbi:MAG: chromate transporter [Lachnospiraceae bacterium]|nr:chromate transporter [Lachnospiraceae bacterium]
MIRLQLFLTFFKIGLFTFGGGYAMIPLIKSEVLAHGWAEAEDIINYIAISESTPGPLAVNMATFIGRTTGGIPGALCATLGVVLPSFLIIFIIAGAYNRYRKSRIIQGVMAGLKPAVVGMIAAALISLGMEVFIYDKHPGTLSSIISVIIFAVMIILSFRKKSPVMIILISGVAGIITGYTTGL